MIIAFTGLPGSGKTYLMTQRALNFQKRTGRDVFANYPIVNGHYFDRFDQIMSVTKGVICADELNALAHAHDWQSLDPKLLTLWTQSRKQGIDFWYTSQSFHMVNNQIRMITNYVWHCEHVFSRLHRATLYDAHDVERDRVIKKIYGRKFFWINQKVYKKYNTFFRIMPKNYDFVSSDPYSLPTFDNDLSLQDPNETYNVQEDLNVKKQPPV